MRTTTRGLTAGILCAAALSRPASAQTPQGTSITYQGRLTEAGALASGAYDFQFVLYDAPADGAQVGPAVALEDVAVSGGLFTVNLDFGAVFGSEKRWLELGVRPGADTGPFTPILPRQELAPGSSAIFSTAAGDSLKLGGVVANQYVQTDDPRLSDARDPLPGSPDYVQNGTVPQPGVSFNVGGTGTADVLDAATQYNLGGARILTSLGFRNLFTGVNAGASNTTGQSNAFFGRDAGASNTTGGSNAFFGDAAGLSNTTSGNSFFGARAGSANTTGGANAFFGQQAGFANTSGGFNSFFGAGAGGANTTGTNNSSFGAAAGQVSNGSGNSYFGEAAGLTDTTGGNNTYVGSLAGLNNTTGSNNTFVGSSALLASAGTSEGNTLLGANARVVANLTNATAVGAGAVVARSDAIVLGAVEGVGGSPGTNVGIGTNNPNARLHIFDDGRAIQFGASAGCAGFIGIAFANVASNCSSFAIHGGDGSTHINRLPGGSIFFKEDNVTQVSIRPNGFLNLQILGSAGSTALCRNATGDISTCSSSLRYKADVASFRGGLEIVERLRPIRFTWKESGQPDIGLAAEEVAEVEPLLAFRNGRGQIEGVNYSQLSAVLVNALNQQEQRLRRQEREIEALRALVCRASPEDAACLEAAPVR